MQQKKSKKTILKDTIDWIIHTIGYTIVFILVTSAFDSIYIDNNHIIIWSAIIVLIISILNNTLKPILVTLTIPLTGVTLGLFYPCINVFILKLVDWALGSHFEIRNIYVAILAAILISIMNFIITEIINSVMKKVYKDE